jgi:hypothetical protein
MRKALFLLPALAACASAHPVPEAQSDLLKAEQLAVTDQSLTDFTAEARMELTNSRDSAMQIGTATWELSLDGKVVATGSTEINKSADPGQTLTFRIPGSAEIVKNADELTALVAHGDQPLELLMRGKVGITQGDKTEQLPFSRTGELRAPRLPVAKMNDADLGRSDEDVTVSFYLGIENQNPFKLKLKSLTYKAELDGQEVGTGIASNGDDLPASETAEFPIQENVTNLDRSKTQIPYHLTGSIDLGLVQIPIDLTGNLTFENKPAKPAKTRKHKSE